MDDILRVTDWTYPQAEPGRGSAIFIHQRRRAGVPTAGRLALRRADLIRLARILPPGTGIVFPDLACFHLGKNTSGSGAAPRNARPSRDKA